ncbi:ROK family protein [Streptococcus cameli]
MAVMCFDIGGTGVKSGLIGADKLVRHQTQIPTPESLEDLLAWMDSCLTGHPVEAISISFPGAVNPDTGIIGGISAVPYIHDVSWYELLASYQVPVFMENDANCAGLSQLAADEVSQDFFCVVCGTGIGGAVILNRRLHRGKKAYAGEFGCMVHNWQEPVENWSQLASTGSLVRYVKEHHEDTEKDWNGRLIFAAAEKGDIICQEAVHRMVTNFSLGLMNLYYTLDPEVIYIGGGISQNDTFLQLVEEKMMEMSEAYEGFPVVPTVRACTYHQDANLMGAYMNTLQ